MLEYYVAYWNYKDNLKFIQEMIREVVENTANTQKFKIANQDVEIDFSVEWEVVRYQDLVFQNTGLDVLTYDDPVVLLENIKSKGIDIGEEKGISLGAVIDRLYKKTSRPNLIQPTFLINHPASLIPLARLNDDDPRVTDSFQVLVNGWEIAKAYSELADPILQRKLLEDQAKMRIGGDNEAMFLDEDFIVSLEHGMPPVSGLGLGIDRLVAIVTGQSNLRDVVLFPLMK